MIMKTITATTTNRNQPTISGGKFARFAALGLATGFMAVGCTKPLKSRIAQLEQQNTAYLSQLELARAQLGDLAQERNNFGDQLMMAREDLNALEAQLASHRERDQTQSAPAGWSGVPGGVMTTIEKDVLFTAGKAELRSEGAQVLDRIVAALNGPLAGKQAFVFGHTDSQPIHKSGWTDNWQLSTERALAVVRYLKSRGVAAERLVAAGCGEHRPRSDNSSNQMRASNRRVEIFAVDPNVIAGG
jgi:chemotaxis protein MotB